MVCGGGDNGGGGSGGSGGSGDGGGGYVVFTHDQLRCLATPPATGRRPLPREEGVREAIPIIARGVQTSHC